MSVICCEVMQRNGMQSHELVMGCGWLRFYVVWFREVVWCGELEDELVSRTTKYCKYYTVIQRTSKFYSVLQDTTKFGSVLHSTA